MHFGIALETFTFLDSWSWGKGMGHWGDWGQFLHQWWRMAVKKITNSGFQPLQCSESQKKAVGKIMESRSTCNPSDMYAFSDGGGLVWLALKAASFLPAQLQLSLSPELVSAKHYVTLAEMLQMSEGESVAHLLLGLGCLSSYSMLACRCQRKAALGCGHQAHFYIASFITRELWGIGHLMVSHHGNEYILSMVTREDK